MKRFKFKERKFRFYKDINFNPVINKFSLLELDKLDTLGNRQYLFKLDICRMYGWVIPFLSVCVCVCVDSYTHIRIFIRGSHQEGMMASWLAGWIWSPGVSTPYPVLGIYILPTVSRSGSHLRNEPKGRMYCWDHLYGIPDWTPLRPLCKLLNDSCWPL